MTFVALFLAIVVGTWNGEWFPSGRAEHRAAPEVEAATIEKAGAMLRAGLGAFEGGLTNDFILCLNEFRGPRAARELAKATGITNLQLAVISGYRRRDRFDMQQDVILTTLPVVDQNWSKFSNHRRETPPRGYAHALIVLEPAVTASVYSVHLKSNYGDTTDEIKSLNRAKRAHAVQDLLDNEKPIRGKFRRPVIIAGDFNADRHREEFAKEAIFKSFDAAGFTDVLESLTNAAERVTHPGKGKFVATALDYIMLRGLSTADRPLILPAAGLSDHRPVFVELSPSVR